MPLLSDEKQKEFLDKLSEFLTVEASPDASLNSSGIVASILTSRKPSGSSKTYLSILQDSEALSPNIFELWVRALPPASRKKLIAALESSKASSVALVNYAKEYQKKLDELTKALADGQANEGWLAPDVIKFFLENPESEPLLREWLQSPENMEAVVNQLNVFDLLGEAVERPEVKQSIGILVDEIVRSLDCTIGDIEKKNQGQSIEISKEERMESIKLGKLRFAAWVSSNNNRKLVDIANESSNVDSERKEVIEEIKAALDWGHTIVTDIMAQDFSDKLFEKSLDADSFYLVILNQELRIKRETNSQQKQIFDDLRAFVSNVIRIKKIKEKRQSSDSSSALEEEKDSIKDFLTPELAEGIGIRIKLFRHVYFGVEERIRLGAEALELESLIKFCEKPPENIHYLDLEVLVAKLAETSKLELVINGSKKSLRSVFKEFIKERADLAEDLIKSPLLLSGLSLHVDLGKTDKTASRRNRVLYVLEIAVRGKNENKVKALAKESARNLLNTESDTDIEIVLAAWKRESLPDDLFRKTFEAQILAMLNLSLEQPLLGSDNKLLPVIIESANKLKTLRQELKQASEPRQCLNILSQYQQVTSDWKRELRAWAFRYENQDLVNVIKEYLKEKSIELPDSNAEIVRQVFQSSALPQDEYILELIDVYVSQLSSLEDLQDLQWESLITRRINFWKQFPQQSPEMSGARTVSTLSAQSSEDTSNDRNSSSSGQQKKSKSFMERFSPRKSDVSLPQSSSVVQKLPVDLQNQAEKIYFIKLVEIFLRVHSSLSIINAQDLEPIFDLFRVFPGGFTEACTIWRSTFTKTYLDYVDPIDSKRDYLLSQMETLDTLGKMSVPSVQLSPEVLVQTFLNQSGERSTVARNVKALGLESKKTFFSTFMEYLTRNGEGSETAKSIFEFFTFPDDFDIRGLSLDNQNLFHACYHYTKKECGRQFVEQEDRTVATTLLQLTTEIVGARNVWASLEEEYTDEALSEGKKEFIKRVADNDAIRPIFLSGELVASEACFDFFSVDSIQQLMDICYSIQDEEQAHKKLELRQFIQAWLERRLNSEWAALYIPTDPSDASQQEKLYKLCRVVDVSCLWLILGKELQHPHPGGIIQEQKQNLIAVMKAKPGIMAKVFGEGIAGTECVNFFSLNDIRLFIEEYNRIIDDDTRTEDKEALASFIQLWMERKGKDYKGQHACWKIFSDDPVVNDSIFDLSQLLDQWSQDESNKQLAAGVFETVDTSRVIGYGSGEHCRWITVTEIEAQLWKEKENSVEFKRILTAYKNRFKDTQAVCVNDLQNVFNTLCLALNMGGARANEAFTAFMDDAAFIQKLEQIINNENMVLVKQILQALFMTKPVEFLEKLSNTDRINQWYFAVRQLELTAWVKEETGSEKIKRERERKRDGIAETIPAPGNKGVGWVKNAFEGSLAENISAGQARWIRNHYDDCAFESRKPTYREKAARYTSWSGFQWLWNTLLKVAKGVSSCYGVSAVVSQTAPEAENARIQKAAEENATFLFKQSADSSDAELAKRIMNLQEDLFSLELTPPAQYTIDEQQAQKDKFEDALEAFGLNNWFYKPGLTKLNNWVTDSQLQLDGQQQLTHKIKTLQWHLRALVDAFIQLKRINSSFLTPKKIAAVDHIIRSFNQSLEKSSNCATIQEKFVQPMLLSLAVSGGRGSSGDMMDAMRTSIVSVDNTQNRARASSNDDGSLFQAQEMRSVVSVADLVQLGAFSGRYERLRRSSSQDFIEQNQENLGFAHRTLNGSISSSD